jgi:transposase InsO family protein
LWEAGQEVDLICRTLRRSRSWFYKWLARYQAGAASWFEAQSRCPHTAARQMPDEVVEVVKMTRLSLYNKGMFCGAQAIRWELEDLAMEPLPSLRTINRILAREELTHRRTGRYEPKGRTYPVLEATQANQVHQSDFVGPCFLHGPVRFYSYNSVDLATGRCAVQPVLERGGQSVIDAIWAVWWRLGIPANQQVDNELVFYGSPAHPRGMGHLIRLCLSSGVEPWFIPPREPWRNGVVEKFNDHYRQRFLARHDLAGHSALQRHSLAFEQRHNQTYRYSKLQGRTPTQSLDLATTPLRWPSTKAAPRAPLSKPRQGRYHLVRYIRSDRRLDVFGEPIEMPIEATYEYVVATIVVAQQKLQIRIGDKLIDQINYRLF